MLLFGQPCDILSILSNHVSESSLPGKITVIWAFSAQHPNQAAAAFCRKTPRRIPCFSVPNCSVMSAARKSIQSTFNLPMRVGTSPFRIYLSLWMRTAAWLSCMIETRWSQLLATRNGSHKQMVLCSPEVLPLVPV